MCIYDEQWLKAFYIVSLALGTIIPASLETFELLNVWNSLFDSFHVF